MMATEPPPPGSFTNFPQDFSFQGHSLHSFHPDKHDVDDVSWGADGRAANNVEFQPHHNHNVAGTSSEDAAPPNNWSHMPQKSIGFSNILSKLSAGSSTPPLAPKDESDVSTPPKFPKQQQDKMKNTSLNVSAKAYAPSPPVSPPLSSRRENATTNNPWSLDNTGMHGKQTSGQNHSWSGNGNAWSNNGRGYDRGRGVRGNNNQPSTSFVIRPAEPSQEDRYECTRLPSGIVVQTHSGQAVEFWERVHVPRSMFDISGLGPNS